MAGFPLFARSLVCQHLNVDDPSLPSPHRLISLSSLTLHRHTEPRKDSNCSAWGQLDFNTSLFPDPPAFIDMVHSNSTGTTTHPSSPPSLSSVVGHPLGLVLNVHPQSGVDHCAERYLAFAEAVGADPSTTIACDVANQTYARALFDVYLSAAPLAGVDAWWTDYMGCGGLHPLAVSNYAFRSHMAASTPSTRPITLSRWGGLGDQSLGGVMFSGDTFQAAEVLDFEVATTATAANVLVGYLSHDIGGFQNCTSVSGRKGSNCTGAPGDADPSDPMGSALFLRWVQFGAVSSIMRTHCTHCERRIWEFASVFPFLRDAFALRAALIPYLYSAAILTSSTGIPFLHPVYYDAPDTFPEAFSYTRQYMLGDSILVAPITEVPPAPSGGGPNATTTKAVWLPPTFGVTEWWSKWDGSAVVPGPGVDTSAYGLGDIPMFVPARIILGLADAAAAAANTNKNASLTSPDLVWNIFPPPPGVTEPMSLDDVTEDDGVSADYKSDAQLTTEAGYTRTAGGAYTVTISSDGITYAGMPATRAHSVLIRGVSPTATVSNVTLQGQPVPRTGPGLPAPGWWINESPSLLAPAGAVIVSAGAWPTAYVDYITIGVTVFPPP
jgi:hypothetical protein